MCLAVPGKIVGVQEGNATVDLLGNRLAVNTVMTPGVTVGEWVLVHAGFAITTIEEREALETWEYLRTQGAAEFNDELGLDDDPVEVGNDDAG